MDVEFLQEIIVVDNDRGLELMELDNLEQRPLPPTPLSSQHKALLNAMEADSSPEKDEDSLNKENARTGKRRRRHSSRNV